MEQGSRILLMLKENKDVAEAIEELGKGILKEDVHNNITAEAKV